MVMSREEAIVFEAWTKVNDVTGESFLHSTLGLMDTSKKSPRQLKAHSLRKYKGGGIPAVVLKHGLVHSVNSSGNFPLNYAFNSKWFPIVKPYITEAMLTKTPGKDDWYTPFHAAVVNFGFLRSNKQTLSQSRFTDDEAKELSSSIFETIRPYITKKNLLLRSQKSEKSETVLHQFAKWGQIGLLLDLQEEVAGPNNNSAVFPVVDGEMLHVSNSKGVTPLHFAAKCNQLHLVKEYILDSDILPLMTICAGHNMTGLSLLLPRMTKDMWNVEAAGDVITVFRRFKREDALLGVELPENLEDKLGPDWKVRSDQVKAEKAGLSEATDMAEMDIF